MCRPPAACQWGLRYPHLVHCRCAKGNAAGISQTCKIQEDVGQLWRDENEEILVVWIAVRRCNTLQLVPPFPARLLAHMLPFLFRKAWQTAGDLSSPLKYF